VKSLFRSERSRISGDDARWAARTQSRQRDRGACHDAVDFAMPPTSGP
jgi:hypothetical protein